MKTSIYQIAIIFSLFLLSTNVQAKGNDHQMVEEIEWTFEVSQAQDFHLAVENTIGTIEIVGTDEQIIRVFIEKIVRSRNKEGIQKGQKAFRPMSQESATSLLLYMEADFYEFDPSDWKDGFCQSVCNSPKDFEFQLNYRIEAPRNVDLFARTSSGPFVSAEGFSNQETIIKNSSGSLEANNIMTEQFCAHTSSGSININDVQSNSLNARTSSGNIQLRSVSGTTEAHTSSGNISVDYTKNPSESSSYTTISGNVNVSFLEDFVGDISYGRIASGNFYSDFGGRENSNPLHQLNNLLKDFNADECKKSCTSKSKKESTSTKKAKSDSSPTFHFATTSGNIAISKI